MRYFSNYVLKSNPYCRKNLKLQYPICNNTMDSLSNIRVTGHKIKLDKLKINLKFKKTFYFNINKMTIENVTINVQNDGHVVAQIS